jgi:Mce-associated membrane protein
MPPSRRRPVPSPVPVRRPRVAGLRHPEAPAPGTSPTRPDSADVSGSVLPGAAVPGSAVPGAAVPSRPVPEPDSTEVTQVIEPITAEPVVTPPEPVAEPVPAEATRATPTRRPRPRPKPEPAVATGAVETVEESDPASSPSSLLTDEEPAADRRRSTWAVPVVLAVVVVLLGGLATWCGLEWAHLRGGAAANTALTDNAGTSEVAGQVTSAVNTTFSYNYTDVAKTEKAAQSLLTGAALCQYNALFKLIQQQAPTEKLVVTTTVTSKGVQMLQGDTARVVLMVDQKDTKVSTNQPVESQAALAVNVVKQNGKWKISNIDTYNGQADTPGCPA